ncbi:rhodanese-related sulfurtransferase [Agrobacterium pusense]|uniref:chromate resistance protein ChrB domain-containing protein n=1 Tax=Agrobacterium pusense TaxID=648995 RepID=UPI001C6F59D0|nr:sulfurtransferase/chromate resistance protein [Agrobacterium pusense]MBW9080583.1 chromate resistance protein [Agrobacterium pusense]MDR6192707.1 rhodanese-related sulfurtransferase [Agrobacterium pusense]
MPSFLEITSDKLNRIVGTLNAPTIIDVRTDEDFASDPRLIPGSVRRDFRAVTEWAPELNGPSVVLCQKGQKLGHGVAAHIRAAGKVAEVLEGGFEAWREAGASLVPYERLPSRDSRGRTVWVTRSRPKIDRIACPWLIRRFIDPTAVFLFVPASEVSAVADRFNATPFDIEEVYWSHRGELCTFDVMVEEFGLGTEPMLRLATIVRGADTSRPDLAPEVAGLLAASLGLSRMFNDDLEQLEAGMTLYDAFYRWCRDATDETHNWPNPRKG